MSFLFTFLTKKFNMLDYLKNIKNQMGDYFYIFILLITMGVFELLSIAFKVNIFNFINVFLLLVIISYISFLVVKKQSNKVKKNSQVKASIKHE